MRREKKIKHGDKRITIRFCEPGYEKKGEKSTKERNRREDEKNDGELTEWMNVWHEWGWWEWRRPTCKHKH